MDDDRTVSPCTLSAEALRERIAMIRSEILPHLKATRVLAGGRSLDFGPELRERLEAWIELERRCCGGLVWKLEPLPRAEGLRLTVEGEDVLARLLEEHAEPRP